MTIVIFIDNNLIHVHFTERKITSGILKFGV
jgi:hypothetical protein